MLAFSQVFLPSLHIPLGTFRWLLFPCDEISKGTSPSFSLDLAVSSPPPSFWTPFLNVQYLKRPLYFCSVSPFRTPPPCLGFSFSGQIFLWFLFSFSRIFRNFDLRLCKLAPRCRSTYLSHLCGSGCNSSFQISIDPLVFFPPPGPLPVVFHPFFWAPLFFRSLPFHREAQPMLVSFLVS